MSNKLWDARNQAFQQAIKAVRKEAGLTQEQLANGLNKPQSYVSKYESGERKLTFWEVRDICEVCETTIVKFNNLLNTFYKA